MGLSCLFTELSNKALKKYCELEGITPDAIKKRLREGVWRQGKEILRVKGFRTLFVDTEAVDEFLRDPKNHDKL